MEEIIAEGLKLFSLHEHVPPKAAAQLAKYGRLLLEKNKVMNLTAITEPTQVARLHMLDSAALLHYATFQGKTLIDVGTGAGLPALPLKILVPTLSVTLLDSLDKRVGWLEEVCQALNLSGVAAIHARAEECAHRGTYREQFDFATARAVADLSQLCELCLPYVKVGGTFLAMKSVDSDVELEQAMPAIAALGAAVEKIEDYQIPHTQIFHRVICIKKNSPTPPQYPRKWKKIKSSPII